MAIDSGEIARFPLEDLGDVRDQRADFDSITDSVADHLLCSKGGPEIAVLIPAYNEELTIGSVVLQAHKYAQHVIVINDGSRDKTSENARAAGAEVIDQPKNGGKAAALQTGFDELKKRDYDIMILMDGDGQHLVGDIDALIMPLINHEADLVIGSRFLKKDNSIPIYRQVGQRILNRATNVGSSKKVSDSQSGFRAFNRAALNHMTFHSVGYSVEQDMIIHCSERGLRITEVPISVRYDVPNGHKQASLSMGLGLLNSVVATVGYKRPLLMFGIPGALLFSAGFVFALLSFFEMYLFGGWLMQGLIAGFMIIIGTTLAVSALSLNSLSALMRMSKSP